ncbi:hypothetical protein RCL1_000658 [Eukaryota sp. TZLM3-RCL]
MQPPFKQKRFELVGSDSTSPTISTSTGNTPTSSTKSTPTKEVNPDTQQSSENHIPFLTTSIDEADAFVKSRISYQEFLQNYKASPPLPLHFESIKRFQDSFPMFHSFLGRFHRNDWTPYRTGLPDDEYVDTLIEHNGIVILCLGFADDHKGFNVPKFFDGIIVEQLNEQRVVNAKRNARALAYEPMTPEDKELLAKALKFAHSFLEELPDGFCVVPVLFEQGKFVLKAFVLHVRFRHVDLGPFPDTYSDDRTTSSIIYINEFIVRSGNRRNTPKTKQEVPLDKVRSRTQIRTRSMTKNSSPSIHSGSSIFLKVPSKNNVKTKATIGSIVDLNSRKYLVTAAHCLPGFKEPPIPPIDTFDSVVDVFKDHRSPLIQNVAPVDLIVRYGNFHYDSNISVYCDIVLIPLPSCDGKNQSLMLNTSFIASDFQWSQGKNNIHQHSIVP